MYVTGWKWAGTKNRQSNESWQVAKEKSFDDLLGSGTMLNSG